MLLKKVFIAALIVICANIIFSNVIGAQTSDKQKLQQVLIRLEQLYHSKQISYDDYMQRKNKVNMMLTQLNKSSAGSAANLKVYYDEAGKPYAFSEADCKLVKFDKLNAVIKPKGFIAYPGGGYSKSDTKYYCLPCVKRINSAGEISVEQIDRVYKPVKDVIFDYTSGASYEYCRP